MYLPTPPGFHAIYLSALNKTLLLPGFPGGTSGKESASSAGDTGLIPGSGRFPGEGNGNPLQDSCLGNLMDRGTWWAIVHGVTKSQTRLSDEKTPTSVRVYFP